MNKTLILDLSRIIKFYATVKLGYKLPEKSKYIDYFGKITILFKIIILYKNSNGNKFRTNIKY